MPFISFNKFNGNQYILSSDRVVINAKKDNVFLLANKDICLSAGGSVHINIGKSNGVNKDSILIVNSPKIQFGLDTDVLKAEPIAKGEQAVSLLNTILDDLSMFLKELSTVKGLVTGGTAELPGMKLAADKLSGKIANTKKQLDKIKSNTTFSI